MLVVVEPAALSHPSIFTRFSDETNFNYLKTNRPQRAQPLPNASVGFNSDKSESET